MIIRDVELTISFVDKTSITISADGSRPAEAAIRALAAFTEPDAIDITPGAFTLADTEEIRAKLAGGAL